MKGQTFTGIKITKSRFEAHEFTFFAIISKRTKRIKKWHEIEELAVQRLVEEVGEITEDYKTSPVVMNSRGIIIDFNQ